MPQKTYLNELVHDHSYENIDLDSFLIDINCRDLTTDPRVLMIEEEVGAAFYLICDELIDLKSNPKETTIWLYYFLNKSEKGICTRLSFHSSQPLNESQINQTITQIYQDIHP